MIRRHADVGRTVGQHLEDRAQDATRRGDLHASLVAMRRCAEEVAEQLVGAVDQVDLHGGIESVTEKRPGHRA